MWLALLSEAAATDCAAGLFALVPSDDEEAPLNVVPVALYLGQVEPNDLLMFDGAGELVSVDLRVRGMDSAVELTPDDPLAPSAFYEFGTDALNTAFVTSAEEDQEPPAPPADVRSFQEHDSDHEAGPVHQLVVQWSADPDARLFLVTVRDAAGAVVESRWTVEPQVWLGQHICSWTGVALPEEELTVEVVARDLAGNQSEAATTTVEFGDFEATEPEVGQGCGCGQAPHGPAGAGLAVGSLVVAGWRRADYARRRRTRA